MIVIINGKQFIPMIMTKDRKNVKVNIFHNRLNSFFNFWKTPNKYSQVPNTIQHTDFTTFESLKPFQNTCFQCYSNKNKFPSPKK